MVSAPLFTPERNECMNCLEPVKWPGLCRDCERVRKQEEEHHTGGEKRNICQC